MNYNEETIRPAEIQRTVFEEADR